MILYSPIKQKGVDNTLKYTNEEQTLINTNKPIDNIDVSLIYSIISKMLSNKEYNQLIQFLNNMNDFAKTPSNLIELLIKNNNKECISIFLDNESILYFLTSKEIDKLKDYLALSEINFKLTKHYNYYYKLLFTKGVRLKNSKQTPNETEYSFNKGNKSMKIKLKDIKDVGIIISYINYKDYNLPCEEQIQNAINYINEYGFNITPKDLI